MISTFQNFEVVRKMRGTICSMTTVAVMLLLLGCWPLVVSGNFLPNAPMHVPRIGRRSDTEQVGGVKQAVGEPVRASKSLYYQLPRNYPRVGRRDPTMPMPHHSQSERRASNNEQLLALWRRAAILDQANRYDRPQPLDTNYDTLTTGKTFYEPSRQYPSKEVTNNEEKVMNEEDLLAPYTRGLRYDGTLFRSLREDRQPYDGGEVYPDGPDYDVPNRGGTVSSNQLETGRGSSAYTEARRGTSPYNEAGRGSSPYNCRGRECSPASEPLERLVKSLLREIVSRRQQQAGEESIYRQTGAEDTTKVPAPRQLW